MNTTIKIVSKEDGKVAVNLRNLNIFRVNETEARILSMHEKGSTRADIASCLNLPLQKVEETIHIFSTLPSGVHLTSKKIGELDELLLMIALDCNMSCGYCYGDNGTYGREKTLMSAECALRAVRTVRSLGNIRTITFFGGEPLLNFEVVKKVVEEVEPDIRCGIITNGTIMTEEMVHFIKSHNLPITVSVDGPERVHNAARCYADGKGTHQKVVSTMDMLASAQIPFGIEATYSKKAVELGYSPRDILEYLYQFTPVINFAAVTVVDDPGYTLTAKEAVQFRTEAIDFTFDLIEKGEPINMVDITAFIYSIAGSERIISRVFCPYHAGRIAVFPNGDVYPCYLLTEDKYYYGNISDSDFVKNFSQKAQKILPMLCRDKLDKNFWFVPLMTHICVSTLVPHNNMFSFKENVITSASAATEHLLYRMSRIRSWKSFFETVPVTTKRRSREK